MYTFVIMLNYRKKNPLKKTHANLSMVIFGEQYKVCGNWEAARNIVSFGNVHVASIRAIGYKNCDVNKQK